MNRLAVGAGLLVLAGLPLVLPGYQVERLAAAVTVALAVLGLVVLTGWTGQISLGNGAFYGVGAYTSAILVARYGWPHVVTLAVAAAVGLACGALAGLPALRVAGVYLALVSLALATVFPSLVQQLSSITGGTQGMAVPSFRPWFGGVPAERWGYWVALVVAVPLFLLVHDLGRGRVGHGLRAIRDSGPAALAVGVPVAAYKVGAFSLAGGLAAVAGSLSVLVQPYPYVDPQTYTIALSVSLVAGLVVGGAQSVLGAVVAAVFLDRAPDLVTGVAHLNANATDVFYGCLLIVLVFLMPTGAVGLAARLSAPLTARRRDGHDATTH